MKNEIKSWLDDWLDGEPPFVGHGLPPGVVVAQRMHKQGYVCHLCPEPILGRSRHFWGQPDKHSYAVLLCRKCNNSAGYRTYYKDEEVPFLPFEECDF